jgi:hypothetical protein
MIHISTNLLSLVAGLVIPFLTALATKELATNPLKWAVLTLLSAAGGIVATALTNGGNLAWQTTLSAAGVTYVTALAAHYGFSVSGFQQKVEKILPNFGLGKSN